MQKLLLILIAFCFLFFFNVTGQTPQRFDIVIDEILADPTPVIGLPNTEFVEIKNTSGKNINLQGWRLNSLHTRSSSFPSYLLAADSFLIICNTANSSSFTPFGKVIGISSFPALDNGGTTLSLTSKEGVTMHSVSYNNTWFQNDVKSNGGWSLEMIDPKNPCSGFSNWKASTSATGGSPGTRNSIDAKNPDKIAPALVRSYAIDGLSVVLTFSEPVDSAGSSIALNFNISDGIGSPISATALAPDFTNIKLNFSRPISDTKVYTVMANNVADCSGNIIHAANFARVGLASVVDTFDVIINEILFNPKPFAVDYVEIFNRSKKVFKLKDFYIANRSSVTNALGSLRQLTTEDILLFPGDFFVISENAPAVKANYAAHNPDNFIDAVMPSLPDDEGVFVLLNFQGKVIDELHYSSKWHFALINNEEGISLERIDYNKPTQNKDNWTSAASTVGFGTPSQQNSQFRTDLSLKAEITITPKTFSPDNDGFDDFTIINIKMSDPGYVANITIFDASGRPVRYLAKNAILASTGTIRWDGLDDKFRKAPIGVYVVFTEVFNLNGKKKSFKNTVVVAARF